MLEAVSGAGRVTCLELLVAADFVNVQIYLLVCAIRRIAINENSDFLIAQNIIVLIWSLKSLHWGILTISLVPLYCVLLPHDCPLSATLPNDNGGR